MVYAKDLLDIVSKWRAQGIRVIAFRPPTSHLIKDLEDHLVYFNQEFHKDFEQAGGQWLVLPEKDYQSFDDSHLSAKGAAEFSSELAHSLKMAIQQ